MVVTYLNIKCQLEHAGIALPANALFQSESCSLTWPSFSLNALSLYDAFGKQIQTLR